MKSGLDAILWLLIAGTVSLIIGMLFTALGTATNPFLFPVPTFDWPLSSDVHTPSTTSPSPDTNPSSTKKPTTSEFCTSKGCTKAASHLMSSIDPGIDPCDDFYQFSCGGYIKNHPLSKGIESISASLEFTDRLKDRVIEHLLAVPLNNQSSIADKKVARFLELCLDADKHGIKQFATTLQQVGGLPFHGQPRPELAEMVGTLEVEQFPLWNIDTDQDNNQVTLEAHQLLSPVRLKNLKEFLKEEAKLLARDMNTTVNEEILNSQLDDHVNLLTAIEKIKSGNLLEIGIKGRSANTFNFTLKQMEETFPELPWRTIAGSTDLSTVQFVGDLNFTRGIHDLWQNGVLNEKNLKEWYVAEYLDSKLVSLGAEYRDLFDDQFDTLIDEASICFQRIIVLMPRWADAFFAEKFAKLKDYTELTKLGANMKDAWLETMRENTWVEPETKQKITKEMADIEMIFGYPIPLYSRDGLDALYSLFDPNDSPTFAEFLLHVPRGEIETEFPDSFSPEVSFSPNAFNYGSVIEMLAGIMEEPFYADDYPLEYKYGAMGFLVGHELTHTFDREGLNLTLLVGDDPQQFDEKIECIVNQFGNITYPLPSFKDVYKYDGELVQGETTSDNTGLRSAFKAYRKERARLYGDHPVKLPGLEELTNDQLFFISFAHGWCIKETERDRLGSFGDVHPLHKTRVNEAVKNLEAFSEAFSCKPNSPMNPPKKCRIWRHRNRRQ